MKNLTKIALSLLMAVAAFGQTGFTSTTLTTAITARGQNAGVGGTSSLTVGSTSGMNPPGLNPNYGSIGSPTAANITYIFIDREVMRVNAVPNSTTVVVERGVQGTKAAGHNALAVVYVAIAPQLANSVPTGACSATTLAYLPVYSYLTGDFYNCPTVGPNASNWVISNSQNYSNLGDGSFFVGPGNCAASLPSGSAGTGNATTILDGAVAALKASSTASAATLLFTCNVSIDSRLTAGKGVTLTSIDFLYSVQTTTATSQVLSTFGSFTGPVPAASETVTSATLTAAGGTITQNPVVGSANLTAVSAGQYYTSRASFGTPVAVNTARQTFVFTFSLAQSASAIQIMTTPGFWVNYNRDVF